MKKSNVLNLSIAVLVIFSVVNCGGGSGSSSADSSNSAGVTLTSIKTHNADNLPGTLILAAPPNSENQSPRVYNLRTGLGTILPNGSAARFIPNSSTPDKKFILQYAPETTAQVKVLWRVDAYTGERTSAKAIRIDLGAPDDNDVFIPKLSPNHRYIMAKVPTGNSNEVAIFDTENLGANGQPVLKRLFSEENIFPADAGVMYGFPMGWLPDGSIIFLANRTIKRTTVDSKVNPEVLGELTGLSSNSIVEVDEFQSGYAKLVPSPSGDKIALFWQSSLGENDELWVANINGSNLRQLTKSVKVGKTTYSYPTWSPDGKWVAFSLKMQGQLLLAPYDPKDDYIEFVNGVGLGRPISVSSPDYNQIVAIPVNGPNKINIDWPQRNPDVSIKLINLQKTGVEWANDFSSFDLTGFDWLP